MQPSMDLADEQWKVLKPLFGELPRRAPDTLNYLGSSTADLGCLLVRRQAEGAFMPAAPNGGWLSVTPSLPRSRCTGRSRRCAGRPSAGPHPHTLSSRMGLAV